MLNPYRDKRLGVNQGEMGRSLRATGRVDSDAVDEIGNLDRWMAGSAESRPAPLPRKMFHVLGF